MDVNMGGILGEAEAETEGLVGGQGVGSTGGGVWEGSYPLPEKKMNFSLEMTCFSELSAAFLQILSGTICIK